MQEAFEKNIEEQLKQFKLEPSQEVWQEVEAALHQKKRRVAPFWWMIFAGIIILSSTLLITYFNDNELNDKRIVKTTLQNNKAQEISILNAQNETNNTKNTVVINANELSNERNQQQIKPSNELLVAKVLKQNQTKIFSDIQKIQALNYTVQAEDNKIKTTTEKDEIEDSDNSITITEQKLYFQKANLLPIESLINTNFSDKEIAKENLIQSNISSIKFNQQNIKTKWFISGSFGILTTTQNGILNNLSTQDALANFGNTGSSLPSGARSNRISYPNGNVYMLGGGFQQQLNKKWSYNVALQYKLLTANISSIDSSVRFSSNKYKAHWIQVPINFSYQLNSSNHPFFLTAGLSGAYAFASNWSYANLSENKFYNNPTKNRKLFVNAQIGAVYTIQKNWLMQVSIEKSLTSVHKKVADKFYYTQFNIQLYKFLNPKNKK